jgi:hypothetical protein
MKYKFQMENGHIFEGSFEIAINDHIAEIEEDNINTAVLLAIEAHGGQEITEEEKPKKKRRKHMSKSTPGKLLEIEKDENEVAK